MAMIYAEGNLTEPTRQKVVVTPYCSRGADILLVIEEGVEVEIEFDETEAKQLMVALAVAIAKLQ